MNFFVSKIFKDSCNIPYKEYILLSVKICGFEYAFLI